MKIELLNGTVIDGVRHVVEEGKSKVVDCARSLAVALIYQGRAREIEDKPKKKPAAKSGA